MGAAIATFVALAVVFLGLSVLHRQPMEAFELQAASFATFTPRMEGWLLEKLPGPSDPIEPNILCYRVTPDRTVFTETDRRTGLTLRLVHGYNVRDCMRIKGYRVEEVRNAERGARNAEPGGPTSVSAAARTEPGLPVGQVWRMVSPAGVTSLWATVMLRADAFEETGRDVCSMPFPRVGTPDDPDWAPGGITVEGLKHPVANTRRAVRGKWNASRSDLLTFLGIRKPAWVQAEWLTLVVAQDGGRVGEEVTLKSLTEVRSEFAKRLREWKGKKVPGS